MERMTREQKLDALQNALNNLPDYELQRMWNRRCDEYGDAERVIYDMSDADEIIGSGYVSEILGKLSDDFSINDDYFRECWDEYESFSDLYFIIDDSELIDYIIEEDDDLDIEEIREILDAEEVDDWNSELD